MKRCSLLLIFVVLGGWFFTARLVMAESDPCVREKTTGDSFKVCFDPGNQLYIAVGVTRLGMGLFVRHRILFDDAPDLTWKLEHEILVAEVDYRDRLHFGQLDGAIYRGRYLRHARDGYLVLPFGLPRKVFVPFDVGAQVTLGRVSFDPGARKQIDVGLIEAAALVDVLRGGDFGARLAIGVGSSWNIRIERDSMSSAWSVAEHAVAPLSMAIVDGHLESDSGLTQLTLRGAVGGEWSNLDGWHGVGNAKAALERVVFAVNDRPIRLYANLKTSTNAIRDLRGDLGFRFSAW